MIKYFLLLIALSMPLFPCTNLLITKGASADGSVMITYNADAGGFMEPLFYLPRTKHNPEDSLEVYDWDSGKYLGKIKQVEETFRVVGNMNEYQVAIGETTFTGHSKLRDTNGIIDYGSLMRITLQRAKTAREAIKIMTDLVEEYGYYSSGESFSVADKNEAWVLDMHGKGSGNKGAVWVAVKIPDGFISAHANQSRIRQFPLNDKEKCLYSPDVISFATENNLYNPDKDGEFSFADVYNPLDAGSLLFCEGRIWSLFSRAAPSMNLSSDYWRCYEGETPYPLYIKPDKKLSVADAIDLMRDHFEGTEFDMTKGLVAEPYGNPYRWKNLTFKLEGDTITQYGWERPISTQQTAFAFVSQSRSWLPDDIGGIFWYGVDDNYSNVYMPLYVSLQEVPKAFHGYSIKEFSFESAFWVFNLVANHAYSKYSYMIKDIQEVQSELEDSFFEMQSSVENTAMLLYKKNPESARNYLSEYSVSQVERTMREWTELWKYLVVKYNDGFVNDVNKNNGRSPKGTGYSNEFNKRVIEEKPEYYKVMMRPAKSK